MHQVAHNFLEGAHNGIWMLLNNPAVSQTVPGDMVLQLTSLSTHSVETGGQSTAFAALEE